MCRLSCKRECYNKVELSRTYAVGDMGATGAVGATGATGATGLPGKRRKRRAVGCPGTSPMIQSAFIC